MMKKIFIILLFLFYIFNPRVMADYKLDLDDELSSYYLNSLQKVDEDREELIIPKFNFNNYLFKDIRFNLNSLKLSLKFKEEDDKLSLDYPYSFKEGLDRPNDDLLIPKFKYDNYFIARRSYNLDGTDLVSPCINYSKSIQGIYINGWTASVAVKMEDLIEDITRSGLNAVVIDFKDAAGKNFFSKDRESSYPIKTEQLKELIDSCHKRGIYVISRIVLFKDPLLAQQRPEYALKYLLASDKEVEINSEKWVNPYNEEVWNYNLEIAKRAVQLGVDEIQFDYIRFPTLANNSKLIIKDKEGYSKTDAIVGFLRYANNLIKDDTLISVDVYGLTTTVKGDLGIGQDIVKMAEHVDYISPMIYPSHYGKGIYGIKDPEKSPYQLITNSLEDAKEKLGFSSSKLRPWLQDFSLYYNYGEEEVNEQIKAVKDNKLSGWLLWNPKSKYTMEALKVKEGEVEDGAYRRESNSQKDES